MNWKLPPECFDPGSATPSELEAYGLPQQPDPVTQPALNRAWRRLFQRPLTWVPAEPNDEPFKIFRTPQILESLDVASTRVEDSRNWSGAIISPTSSSQFVQVFGEWTMPVPFVPPNASAPGTTYRNALWIALDGDHRYFNSSMPQVGTQQEVTSDALGNLSFNYYVWFQWWLRGVGSAVVKLNGVHADGGLDVMGLIWAYSKTQVLVLFRNFGAYNQITGFTASSPHDPRWNIQPEVSGATAEWILERPSIDDADDLEPFAGFPPTQFRNCVAGVAGAPGFPTSEKALIAPRFKRMYERVGALPSKTKIISIPVRDASDITTFELQYQT